MGDVHEDYWKLREALLAVLWRADTINHVVAGEIHQIAADALRETDLANRLVEPVEFTDAQIDALIRSDQGDSYYVTLPDGSTQGIGFTAESWSEPSERRAAARRVLKSWSKVSR